MEPTAAAKDLYNELVRFGWLVSVGIGGKDSTGFPILVVYATDLSKARQQTPPEWHGFSVRLKRMGRVRPATRVG